ncbi:hypothetical protein ROZALSC1DRAFT_29529 [Rozella allomycis CSF55]|uniref:Uncharacterized protein n=1 Tax=Rozella allomycis (strain CSF55) TaxID=988480 RepID=A0A075AR98_ROZAC|nr:hypothetical protein O9G_000838 [Rozella allomycis CSF55]RKP18822.1 hypothetical protein ROZALSC1DRAFT_29529 [Rozella allomycis CSF55]|eukprot:EPZ32763.1 hypothetical protein O9G_000838 [Rozella allomycis CSF55]
MLSFQLLICITLLLVPFVSAHSFLVNPPAKLTVEEAFKQNPSTCGSTFDPKAHNVDWPGPIEENAKGLRDWMQKTKTTLKDIASIAKCETCGHTDGSFVVSNPKGPVQIGGLIHHGPCEVWLGSKRVFYEPFNCPSSINIDYSSCKDENCLLRVFLAGTHLNFPEFFEYCVTVKGTGANSSKKETDISTKTDKSTPKTQSDKQSQNTAAKAKTSKQSEKSETRRKSNRPKKLHRKRRTCKY